VTTYLFYFQKYLFNNNNNNRFVDVRNCIERKKLEKYLLNISKGEECQTNKNPEIKTIKKENTKHGTRLVSVH
jgi:hypothetical protein